jgi:hypothetical protein
MLGHAPLRSSELEPLSEEHSRLASSTVDQLAESVNHAEQTLRGLGLLLEGRPLPTALIGALGISLTEMRSQLPALREAVKEASG